MARDYTYRYSVHMRMVRGYATPAGWATKSRIGHAIPAYLAGKPTAAKLARYIADYNESLKPGGVNAHIGLSGWAIEASITDHRTGAVVATWEATPGDMYARA